VRKAVVTAGVSYHYALTGPEGPCADFDILDVHRLFEVDLTAYTLVIVLRSVDSEALWVRRHQFARFLDRGGVLITFGEAWTNWFPGCRWEAECPEDLPAPLLVDHPLLEGITPEAVHWHTRGPRWCNHGHLVPPAGAEVLVGNQRGDAWLYIDRRTTNGVILAATNVDIDTHTFHRNSTACLLMGRVLTWAETEAQRSPERRLHATRKIAGLFSGVNFQRGFYEDKEFGKYFASVPAEELAGIDLTQYLCLWIPRESDQRALVQHRDRLVSFLSQGGTLVSFDEVNQPWLDGLAWVHRGVDVNTLGVCPHWVLEGIGPQEVSWHAHGVFKLPPGGVPLIIDQQRDAVLYLDEHTYAPGRILAGTLDPDCHTGYGSDLPRPLLRAILRWVFAERLQTIESRE
jgi:hypothetical protein